MRSEKEKKTITQVVEQDIMDEYVELLILAYFKEFHENYDLTVLKEKVGLSYGMLDEYLNELIDNNKIEYRNNLLVITQLGRLSLAKSKLENYSYTSDLDKIYSNDSFDLETIYCVHEFSNKKWRGSE